MLRAARRLRTDPALPTARLRSRPALAGASPARERHTGSSSAGRRCSGGDEDVAVQLEVRDAGDGAVGGERPLLVLAAEELDLDLLARVLVRVVLHGLSLAA